jgi:hypothetical protein
MFSQFNFDFDWSSLDKELQELDEVLKEYILEDGTLRKDYCHDCKNDELYWQAMAAKCTKCNKIILGG